MTGDLKIFNISLIEFIFILKGRKVNFVWVFVVVEFINMIVVDGWYFFELFIIFF